MLHRILILLVCSLVVGCNSGSILNDKRTLSACPPSYIIRDLSLQTTKDPESKKLLGKTHIDRIRPRCQVDGNQMQIQLNPQITAQRFSAEEPKKIETSYFIALVNADSQLVGKQAFPVSLEFEEKQRRVHELPSDTYEIELPESIDLKQLKIYIGFQIDNQQWVENRNKYERHQLASVQH